MRRARLSDFYTTISPEVRYFRRSKRSLGDLLDDDSLTIKAATLRKGTIMPFNTYDGAWISKCTVRYSQLLYWSATLQYINLC